METLKKVRIFNSNTLKLIAAVSMLIDHMGLLLFPHIVWLRYIGRLAMPIFAFAIAEGCRYTKNKAKHFFLLFGLGAVCQLFYYFFDPDNIYFGILITFSFSILMIYALQYAKKCVFNKKAKWWIKIVSCTLFIALVAFTYLFCKRFHVDYGIYGCMLPVFASLLDFHRIPAPDWVRKFDLLPLRVLCMSVLLIFYVLMSNSLFTVWCLFSIPILLLYNGEKGKWNMKYFFYIFYPSHLAILEGIAILQYLLR